MEIAWIAQNVLKSMAKNATFLVAFPRLWLICHNKCVADTLGQRSPD